MSRIVSLKRPGDTECVLSLAELFLFSYLKVNQGNITTVPSCLIYFISVSEIMEKQGILRNYWEGGVQGEGIGNHMKPLVSIGTHIPGFASSTLTKYYKNDCVSKLI